MSTETGASPRPDTQTPKSTKAGAGYTRKLGAAICQWVGQGKTLSSFCAIDSNPSRETVNRWLEERERFRADYADALEAAADILIDDIIGIADERGKETSAADKKVRIWARQVMAEKLAPWKHSLKPKPDVEEDEQEVIVSRDSVSEEEWAKRYPPNRA